MSLPAPKDSERPSGVRGKSLSEFMGAKPRDRRRYVPIGEKIDQARAEMAPMAASGEWEGATGMHLVALYEFLHREVYGVEALELGPKEWTACSRIAESTVAKFFEGDYGACVSFVRWVWQREQGREEWRKANNRGGQRIGWRLQFAAVLVSDYRVNLKRVEK